MRELRGARGMTQQVLAERAGVSVEYVSRLERERLSPTLDGLERIARGLAIEPSALLWPSRDAPKPRTADEVLGQVAEVISAFRRRDRRGR